jgi:acyl-coenzyme A thioesterase PaaI-like protein
MLGPELSISASDLCFGCGEKNPCGLKLKFDWDGKSARSQFTPTELHQGWQGIIHGGILTSLLDEAMAYAACFAEVGGVTAVMETKFRRPVAIGEPLDITAWISKKSRRFVETEAKLTLADGTVVAEAKATQYLSKDINIPIKREESP